MIYISELELLRYCIDHVHILNYFHEFRKQINVRYLCNIFVILANSNRRASNIPRNATLRGVVWWQHVSLYGKKILGHSCHIIYVPVLFNSHLDLKWKNCSKLFYILQPEFYSVCHTKKQYEEFGPSICRHNLAFGSMG